MSHRTRGVWGAAGVLLFGGLSVFLGVQGWHKQVSGFGPALLTVNVTLAVFAVNFSFLEYQFSPYRALLKSVSRRQVVGSLMLLLVALSPLPATVLNSEWEPTVALFAIPLVAYGSVWLSTLARRESTASLLLLHTCSTRSLHNFLDSFAVDAERHLKEIADLELSPPTEMPPHEWGSRTPPTVRSDDPFVFLNSLGIAAIQSSDIYTFQQVAEQIFKLLLLVNERKHKDGPIPGYQVDQVIRRHTQDLADRLALAAIDGDKSAVYVTKWLDISAAFMRKQAIAGMQTSELSVFVMRQSARLAENLLKRGLADAALVTVVVARQVAHKGITAPSKDVLFEAHLPYLAGVIVQMGRAAIDVGDSEFLYRCLDALGWLGCSAMKADHRELGTACLQGLIQLGRLARAAKLECFWSHCALLPADHADERIQWIASWISKLDQSSQRDWLECLGEAFSRLRGFTCELSFKTDDAKPRFVLAESDEPHRITYSDNGTTRTVDYSDFSFVKELKLY